MDSKIAGVRITELSKFEDDRGWLGELFRSDCLLEEDYPQMGYISMTLPGVTRGPHEHLCQIDMFAFIGPGDFELYLWDKSLLDPHREKYICGESNPVVVMVPPGIIHAYKNVSDKPGFVFNFPNKLYAGPGKSYPVDEIRHEEKSSSLYKID